MLIAWHNSDDDDVDDDDVTGTDKNARLLTNPLFLSWDLWSWSAQKCHNQLTSTVSKVGRQNISVSVLNILYTHLKKLRDQTHRTATNSVVVMAKPKTKLTDRNNIFIIPNSLWSMLSLSKPIFCTSLALTDRWCKQRVLFFRLTFLLLEDIHHRIWHWVTAQYVNPRYNQDRLLQCECWNGTVWTCRSLKKSVLVLLN